MNILQTIIQNTRAETEEVPIYTSQLNPSGDTFITNVPVKTYSLSLFNFCLYIYSYILAIEWMFKSFTNRIFLYRLNKQFKRDMLVQEKDMAERRKIFIAQQVSAMKHAIGHFNNTPTLWEDAHCKTGEYRIREHHTLIKDRNIRRHWYNQNPTELVVS